MYERRLKGYSAIGCVIEQEPFSPDPSVAATPIDWPAGAVVPPVSRTLQKPSINMCFETDPCFVGVFYTLNQRLAQLYY